ncbi:Pho91p [Sugiyamaella lignohabitans]|uniref:Pho91p n=1 Tax=Sugiyamaella lignohabitans TaxID=796027 RepID=A0A161HHA3_9ASCO|nr:Pho91p [Sugiyamaella lignohabitans]ANB15340.1 Pho91p [Sugiyamaella lignohabitans]
MKFNHSLQFNAVPEWISKYIDYGALKKLTYQLEKEAVEASGRDAESAVLIEHDPEAAFRRVLDIELEKIDLFYTETESKIFDDLDYVLADAIKYEQRLADEHVFTAADGVVQDDQKYLFPVRSTSQASSSGRGYSQSSGRRGSGSSGESLDQEDDGGSDPGSKAYPSLLAPTGSGHQDADTSIDEDHVHLEESDPRPYYARRRRSRSASVGVSANSRPRRGSAVDIRDMYLLSDHLITLKKRTSAVYVSLSELKSYIDLNRTGFRKALKKFDKTLHCELMSTYMEEVLGKSYAFSQATTEALDSRIAEAVSLYARLATNNDVKTAGQQLKLQLREHIVWERNTVWRDMIGIERQTQGTFATRNDKPEAAEFVSILGVSVPAGLVSASTLKVLIISSLFFAILLFPILEVQVQNNCLAVVIAASLFWATEAMPLFVTSLLIPFLVVCLRIPVDAETDERMSASEASKFIFSQMWSSVIMILLGGFTLAAALSKYQIAKILATSILSRAGTNPRVVLLTLMFVATFLSMWISNVAAPVLCYSLAQPLLRTLPEGDGFAKAIILGIALASNIGGMVSPIASPQNIIALENMDPAPSWVQWFTIAIPVSAVGLLLIWLFLIFTFPTGKGASAIPHVRASDDRFTFVHYYICVVSVGTIVLWCFSHQLEPYVGEMGVLALVPVVLLFGPGLLSSADFNNFLWTIIALAMGGIALGKAVSSSGLLAAIALQIEALVRGMSLFNVMLVFGFMILTVATFVSHTVAALIVLPLVKSIGEQMPDPHPRLLVMASALLCSAAMGLPTSGFPNVTAICMTDELGKPYLTVGSFISRGVPSSILVYLVIASLGYVLMSIVGF